MWMFIQGGRVTGLYAQQQADPPAGILQHQVPPGMAPVLGDRWDGSAVIEDLTLDRAEARRRIDETAEAVRLTWITPGSGQAAVYQRKADEARRWMAQGAAGAPYPLLDASIGIEGPDRATIAGLVIAQETAWLGIAAQIEALRLTAKAAIGAVTTRADLHALMAQLIAWPVAP